MQFFCNGNVTDFNMKTHACFRMRVFKKYMSKVFAFLREYGPENASFQIYRVSKIPRKVNIFPIFFTKSII